MIRSDKKIKITALFALAILASCSAIIPNLSLENSEIISKQNQGTLIQGVAEFPEKNDFKTKATIYDVRSAATVALIYPPDHPDKPNQTIATGLSNTNGVFIINPDASFIPSAGDLYVLEATKRIGNAGKALMSVRTYLQWTGITWKSISTPGVRINKNTTALTIIDAHDSSISSASLIDGIVSGVVTDIGSLSTATINQVSGMVDFLLTSDVDPARFIVYQNSKYYLKKEFSLNKTRLIQSKECPNCDLSEEDLTGIDLVGADLSNANLSNIDFRNANLTGTNLSGATFSNSDLSGATWTNGNTCGFDSIGKCIFPDIRVNSYTTNYQAVPSVAIDADGDFVVTWDSYEQEGFLNSFLGVYAQRYNSSGTLVGSEFLVNTFSTGRQMSSAVAMDDDGDFVVVWQHRDSTIVGSTNDIYAQRYSSNGSVNGSEFRVNSYTTNQQISPAVAMDSDGDFVVTWSSYSQDGSKYGVYARRYDSFGTAIGTEFRVNTSTNQQQMSAVVAMDDNANFLISWYTNANTLDFGGVFAQRYDSSGVALGTEFRVNSYTTGVQSSPSVSMDADGDFVITWQSDGQDRSIYGVYAQRYTSNGEANGSEFRVNTNTFMRQENPAVSLDAQGNFVITWQSIGQDGSYWGIYGQRYAYDGTVLNSEFRINFYTNSGQLNPVIALDNDGDFVVSWQSEGQDGAREGIYLKRYDSSGQEK